MDSEPASSERHQLVDFARSMVERARQRAHGVVNEAEPEFWLSFRENLDPKAIAELLSNYRYFFDGLRAELTHELDTVLLTVERLSTELTTLRGEVAGLRRERTEFLSRLKQTEHRLDAAAGVFSRPTSGQVTPSSHSGSSASLLPDRPNLRTVIDRLGRRSSIPRDAKAIALGDRARDARDWRTAARHYRKALDRRPDNPSIWVQYGHALKESGNKTEAESAYERSIELAPKVPDTHLQLGHVLKIQGKPAAAAGAYLRALTLDPSLHDARAELLGLGWTHARIERALQSTD